MTLSAGLALMLASVSGPTVVAPAGAIEGVGQGGVKVFRGIPYAAPPVGALRWRAPQPLARWRGKRKAAAFGAICMQPPNATDSGIGLEAPSEDCLTLSIWAPAGPKRGLPVMVWLHGGGYTSGSGSAPLYDGRALAARGVVVVTLNYRLGRFGFFAHPGVPSGEGANFGLLDQRAALRWVRANIAAFGGDPTRVTLFGNSAGGESVLFHISDRASHGLFARAIVQSGLGGRALRTGATSVDADRAATPIEALRALPASAILGWGAPSLYRGFGPTIDGVTVRANIEAVFRARRQAAVPLIIGYNSFEFPPAAMGGAGAAVALVGHDFAERARGAAAYGSVAAYEERIASDALFRAPALRLAALHAAAGHPSWAYEFDVAAPAIVARFGGAPHASERAYVFGTLPRLGWPTDARDVEFARELGDAWVAFARGGAPWSRTSEPKLFTRATAPRTSDITPQLADYLGLR